MALDADTLLDRMRLKQQLVKWRSLAIIFLMLALLVVVNRSIDVSDLANDYIAQVTISGIIADYPARDRMFEKLAENDSVKAVIIRLDSPGGTAIGGEELYLSLKQLSEEKPVVALMRSLCASACYMSAVGTDRIFAREGTLTGSVGVIFQSADLTEMARSLGIEPIVVKSGPNKAAPNPLEEITDTQREMVEAVVDDFYAFFVDLVKEERQLDEASLPAITDGRIFTGSQALDVQLVDQLGGKQEALEWLESEHDIVDMKIKNITPQRNDGNFLQRIDSIAHQIATSVESLAPKLDGLVSIWHPAQH